jgi:hypothetical protein
MRTHVLLILFGVAACGGELAHEASDGGTGVHSASIALAMDGGATGTGSGSATGSASGTSSTAGMSSRSVDGGLSQPDAEPSDATVACKAPSESAHRCIFCTSAWYCPANVPVNCQIPAGCTNPRSCGCVDPQCPAGIAPGGACEFTDDCVVCGSNGLAVLWTCGVPGNGLSGWVSTVTDLACAP